MCSIDAIAKQNDAYQVSAKIFFFFFFFDKPAVNEISVKTKIYLIQTCLIQLEET